MQNYKAAGVSHQRSVCFTHLLLFGKQLYQFGRAAVHRSKTALLLKSDRL